MNSTYAQKSSTVQKATDTKAASVLDSSAQSESLQRKANMANNAAQRAEAPRPNNTGMPDNLKAGIESLSGFSMDNVRVHYNSSKPATVQALAYTQGTDIHVAPGQEKCLPHEAWHVAQQMAGRVSPTTNINGMPVNDNAALEREADVMGEKAVQCKKFVFCSLKNQHISEKNIQCKFGVPPYPHLNLEGTEKTKFEQSSIFNDNAAPEVGTLPCIAFETLASEDRANELIDLYNKEIIRYKGKALIFMGVNACAEKTKNVKESLENEDSAAKKVNSAVNSIVSELPTKKIKQGHGIIIIPFLFAKVGSDVSYYPFPYNEGRLLLMNSAKDSEAGLFRWIDSDVRNDDSIDGVVNSGFCDDEANPQINSGFYKWRTEADEASLSNDIDDDLLSSIKTARQKRERLLIKIQKKPEEIAKSAYMAWYKKIIEFVNESEINLRKEFFSLNSYQEKPDKLVYFPESTLFMNKKAHKDAISALNIGNQSGDKQDRESERVVNYIAENNKGKKFLKMNGGLVLDKPLKKEFTEDSGRYSKPLEVIAGLKDDKKIGFPIVDKDSFEANVKGIRQSAFGNQWGESDKKADFLNTLFGTWLDYLRSEVTIYPAIIKYKKK